MALTFYEDIAISHIKKREEAETNVSTKVYDDLHSAVDFVIDKLKRGKQAFIVCPSIVDAEGNNLMSIESFLRDFGNLFSDFSICVMHGKLKNDEKEQAMADFSSGKTQLLIATTVIEVGIDTKASEILILNADRFGLASLHQLRGRVGRDGSEAHCLLHSSNKGERAIQRLETLEKSNDGQYLAEMDFAMRGAGDFLGVKCKAAVRLRRFFHCKSMRKPLKRKRIRREKPFKLVIKRTFGSYQNFKIRNRRFSCRTRSRYTQQLTRRIMYFEYLTTNLLFVFVQHNTPV